jgi:hypothetical protein
VAVPLNYTIADGTVTGNFKDLGLVIHTQNDVGLAGTSFTLNDGASYSHAFFDIWTDEGSINSDDLVPMAISATLNFSDPLSGVTIDGVTVGGSILFGLAQWGQVHWNGPVTITLDDRVFTFALSDEIFNFGLFGLSGGEGFGATVSATITQTAPTLCRTRAARSHSPGWPLRACLSVVERCGPPESVAQRFLARAKHRPRFAERNLYWWRRKNSLARAR